MRARAGTGERTPMQRAAQLLGIVFLIVGIAGFIPGITTDYGQLSNFSSPGAKLLGIFGVNWLENIVHLLYGVAGLALASTYARARAYFIWGGAIYLVLWLYGLIIEEESTANFLGLNEAAHWLHLALGVVMIAVGFALARGGATRRGVTA